MKKKLYIASFSGGKDSTAMVLLLTEMGYPLDKVIFYDTGVEFACVYLIVDKIRVLCEQNGIEFVRLSGKDSFLYNMLLKPVKKRDGTVQCGYKWCGGCVRWGTLLKLDAISKYYLMYADYEIVEYVGIALDEPDRVKGKNYPLVELGYTEEDCLRYCHTKGYYWFEGEVELYSILDRVSCKYCRNKNLRELRNIYKYLPTLYDELCELERLCGMSYRSEYSLQDLRRRFEFESSQILLEDYVL